MKNIIGLFILAISPIFSFDKMSDGQFFEKIGKDSNNMPIYNKIIHNDLLKRNDKLIEVYCYDKKTKYYILGYLRNLKEGKKVLPLFKQQKFVPQWWESNFDPEDFFNDIPPFLCIHYPYFSISDSVPAQQIKSDLDRYIIQNFPNRNDDESIECFLRVIALFEDELSSKSEVHVKHYKTHVTLSRNNEKSKEINLQAALLKYMKYQKDQQDQLFEFVSKFIYDLRNQTLIKNNQSIIESILKIRNAIKTTYTQNQIDLLENSKILTVWVLPLKSYNNKKYREQLYPNADQKGGSKIINPIMIGFAYDKRDGITYNWIIDLGQDISVLFDYADELEQATK